MTGWNYRIILHAATETDPAWYGLHEVYYGDDNKPESWTEQPTSFIADEDEGPKGIWAGLAMALNDALQRPVLVEQDGKLVALDTPPRAELPSQAV